jgi:ESF2/ABP1 family protein
MGGNHKIKYVEGWIEFDKKKEAKMAAMVLNNQLMGGKKRHNMFHDDTW